MQVAIKNYVYHTNIKPHSCTRQVQLGIAMWPGYEGRLGLPDICMYLTTVSMWGAISGLMAGSTASWTE